MPIYEFYCHDCMITREALIRLKDYKKRPDCPKCKKEMEKYIGKVHLSSRRVSYGY